MIGIYIADIVQTMQFILLFVILMFAAIQAVRLLRLSVYTRLKYHKATSSRIAEDYSISLYVADYEAYHKYQIWRFYLFSI